MSKHTVPIPMEGEEVGREEYMLDYQRMLDGPDSPSEVQGEGVGDCAGGVLVVREAGVMGREGGGLKAAMLSHYPSPRIQSFLVLSIGLMNLVLKVLI